MERLLGAGRPPQAEGPEAEKLLVSAHPQRCGIAMGQQPQMVFCIGREGQTAWVCRKSQPRRWLSSVTKPVDMEQEAGGRMVLALLS